MCDNGATDPNGEYEHNHYYVSRIIGVIYLNYDIN